VSRWSEKLLVRRIRAGDREACAQLVLLHHAPVYQLLARLCHDAHLAEDLTQETFAAAWAGLDGFKGTSSLGTWLHRIAYRKYVDAHRRDHHRAARERSAEALEHIRSHGPSQFEAAVADERSRGLHEAMDILAPDDRHVLVLHYLQGLSFREMVKVLEEPVGTVKWRTSQALARLREALKGWSDDDA